MHQRRKSPAGLHDSCSHWPAGLSTVRRPKRRAGPIAGVCRRVIGPGERVSWHARRSGCDMTLVRLVVEVEQAGIELRVDGDQIRSTAPAGALTAERRATLA